MMKVPLFDPTRGYPAIAEELEAAALRVLRSGNYILGEEVEAFEQALSAKLAHRPVVGVSSGTDALILALTALSLGPGDEVITSPFSFIATAEAIAAVGATPVFADIDPHSWLLSPEAVREQITPNTKAVLAVHLYGDLFDPTPLQDLWDRGILLVEDAAQAQGAHLGEAPAGTLGSAGCFSFFPSKILGGFGDGGAICFGTKEAAAEARSLRVHGRGTRAHFAMRPGYNARLDALQAALLNIKLSHLEENIRERRRLAARYTEQFHAHPDFADLDLHVPNPRERPNHAFNYYVIRAPAHRRECIREGLGKSGVSTNCYYPTPLHLQPAMGTHKKPLGTFPVAERAAERTLTLPLFPGMRQDEQDYVVEQLFNSLK